MTGIELEALRRLLFFSRPEAGVFVGEATERAWNMWERNARPVPDDVAARMRVLCAWRAEAVARGLAIIQEARRTLGEPEGVALVWYPTLETWMTLPDREPYLWRPHCSVVAQVISLEPLVRAVAFDPPIYRAWLGKRIDSEDTRAEWATLAS